MLRQGSWGGGEIAEWIRHLTEHRLSQSVAGSILGPGAFSTVVQWSVAFLWSSYPADSEIVNSIIRDSNGLRGKASI